jgi:hypothetical protein
MGNGAYICISRQALGVFAQLLLQRSIYQKDIKTPKIIQVWCACCIEICISEVSLKSAN